MRNILKIGSNPTLSPLEGKYLLITNAIALVLALSMLFWIGLSLLYLPALNYNLVVFSITFIVCLAIYYFMHRGYYFYSKLFLHIAYSLSIISQTILLGHDYYIHLLLIPVLTIGFYAFKKEERIYQIALCALGFVSFFYFEFFYSQVYVVLQNPIAFVVKTAIILQVFFALTLTALATAMSYIKMEAELQTERDRSENLLLNILPKSIANRLESNNSFIADSFANVSILFADIVGFTTHSSNLPPENIVAELNEVFTQMDDLAMKYNLEKIKTIGDCYMVAGGLPEPNEQHAKNITQFALETLEVLNRINATNGSSLAFRIGINSGPVVAGVIGKSKFIYDLWGDTVNIASRMESHGMPGQIQISAATYEIIKNDFEIETRGEIDVKGKGLMKAYIVKK
jgi:class 3 adenylate cyclase